MHTIAVLDDSNLAHRGGAGGLAFAQRAARGFIAQGGDLRPGEHTIDRKRERSDQMPHDGCGVARNDLDTDAGGFQPRDSARCAGLGRIDEYAVAGKNQLGIVIMLYAVTARRRLPGHGQQAQAFARPLVVQSHDPVAERLVERNYRSIGCVS